MTEHEVQFNTDKNWHFIQDWRTFLRDKFQEEFSIELHTDSDKNRRKWFLGRQIERSKEEFDFLFEEEMLSSFSRLI